MNVLAAQTLAYGLWMTVVGGALIAAAPAVRRVLQRFPRHRLSAWVLTVVVLGWSGTLLYHGPLGFLEPYRDWLFFLIPLAIVLVGVFVDELLAVRALGGLLLLLPTPLLAAARWHPSPWRYVVIALAYMLVLKGATLVAAPYLFRLAVERWLGTDAACRRWGGVALAAGIGLLVLGAFVY